MTNYKTVSEWGSKARKAEANAYRGNNNRAVIEEGVYAFAADADEYDEPQYKGSPPRSYESNTIIAALEPESRTARIVRDAAALYEPLTDEQYDALLTQAVEVEAQKMTFERAGALAATRCSFCGEPLGTANPTLLADCFVYERDGELDCILLAHAACAEGHDGWNGGA